MIDFASRRSLIVTMLTSGVLAAVVVFAAVLDSRAAPIYGPPGSESNVVVMDCSETEDDTFAVDDLSASGEVDVKVGDDCAAALNSCRAASSTASAVQFGLRVRTQKRLSFR